jgi:hypothetical protein
VRKLVEAFADIMEAPLANPTAAKVFNWIMKKALHD